MQRRDFLATAATVGVAATVSVSSSSSSSLHAAEPNSVPGDQRANAKLRFCSQLGIIPGGNNEEKLKWMKQNGFEAVEIGRLDDNYLDWKKRADDAGLRIASICIGSFGNKLTDEDPEKRKQGFDELKVQLERAGALGANGVVYVPATGKPDRPNWRIRELTVAMLKELGPFAAEHKTHIIMEPLRRGEAWFLRQVGDAAQIAKDAGVAGVAVLGDTYHMYTEEPDDMAAFIAGGTFVKHVHLGNGTKRRLPGQDNHCHIKAMRGLKYIGYSEFISYECGVDGDKAVEVPKSVEYLKKCWDEA
ncbi:MAG: sugar phosphate isomerase/epimerase [Planctomycetaceae bacterium]|jgi:sugar phosphate isomerase/epimerase|nr:sugar phosphate isomerase/epimerase [Planctomycetaceae bacterium]